MDNTPKALHAKNTAAQMIPLVTVDVCDETVTGVSLRRIETRSTADNKIQWRPGHEPKGLVYQLPEEKREKEDA